MARDPRLVAAAEKAGALNNGRDGFANAALINVYRCEADPTHIMVTVDREPGTTPFTTECIHCKTLGVAAPRGGFYRHPAMRSAFYRVPQDLQPTHEWYRPDILDGFSPGMVDHLLKGGLDLRRIGPDPAPAVVIGIDPAGPARPAALDPTSAARPSARDVERLRLAQERRARRASRLAKSFR